MIDKKAIKVAVPGPFLNGLDYLMPEASESLIGKRVWVNVGRRKVVGVVLSENIQSEFDPSKLKSILSVIDQRPLFDHNMMRLLHKVADYYQAPIGEVFYTAMPTQLCKGKDCSYQKKYAVNLNLSLSKAMFPLNEDQEKVLEAAGHHKHSKWLSLQI